MWRTRAVVTMLIDDIAKLDLRSVEEGDSPSEPETELLAGAIRRARLVVAVDCLAILVLFVFRDSTRPFLPINQTIETVFTAGVLAVAVHAGFRWAQLEGLRSVRRLCAELREREES